MAIGAGGEGDRPLHERTDVGLHRLDVLREVRLLDLRDQAGVREVDALDLDLRRVHVEQVVELLLGELRDRLVRIEEAATAVDAAVPAIHVVARDRKRAFVQRLGVVVERREIEIADRAHALTARAHAASTTELALLPHLLPALLDGDRSGSADVRHVERERVRPTDVRLRESAEDDPQHGVGIRGGADR